MDNLIRRKKTQGFTLLEMMLVIAILTVLFALIIFSVRPANLFKNAQDQKVDTETSMIKAAVESYKAFNDKLPDAFNSLTSGEYVICALDAANCPANGIDLSELVEDKFLQNIPILDSDDPDLTGYSLSYDADTGLIDIFLSSEGQNFIESEGTYTFTADTVIGSATTYDNYDIVVNSGVTVTMWGEHTFASVAVQDNGRIVIGEYNGTEGTGMLDITANTLSIDGTIEGSGRGYGGGGGGGATTYEAHAGKGGNSVGGGGAGGGGGQTSNWPGYCGNPGAGGTASLGNGFDGEIGIGGCGVVTAVGGDGGNGNLLSNAGSGTNFAGGGGGGGSFGGNGGNGGTDGNGGSNGGYKTLTANGDTSTDFVADLGSGGGGGSGCNGASSGGLNGEGLNGGLGGAIKGANVSAFGGGLAGGGGGGAGGAAILLYGIQSVEITGSVISNGGAGGNSGAGSCNGGGGAGGGIAIKSTTIDLSGATIQSVGNKLDGSGSTTNGGTIKVFYENYSGPTLNTTNFPAGRVYSKDTSPVGSSNINITFQGASSVKPSTETDTALQVTVPNGVASGNVSLTSLVGTSNNLAYTVEDGSVPSTAGEGTTWASTVQGTIAANTVWSQNILVTGDVTVNSGVTLTINPGVTVFFAANSDALVSGLWTSDSEILVYGTLVAEGTAAQPIYFTSNAATKASEDWGGIVFKRGSLTSSIKKAVIHYASTAFRIHHWDEAPNISIKASITDSRIENNQHGVYLGDGHPQTWTSTLDNLNMNVRNNLIQNNTGYGVTACPVTGYGSIAVTDTDIIGNQILNNGTGMVVCSASWWLGHNDIYPNIKYNTIKDSSTIGIDMSAHGASDGSGSDTDVKPVIQNNYFENNPVHIKMHMVPYYAEGVEILSPNIQYNSFNGGTKVFEFTQTASSGTVNPTIQNNLFYGQSGYIIDNTTARTITANSNFWGATPAQWDDGPQAGNINGTVVTTIYLMSTDDPMISSISNNKIEGNDVVSIYGAITGRSGESQPTPVSTPTPTVTPTPPVSSYQWERCLGNYTTCNAYCASQGKSCSNSCTGFGGCTGTTNGYNQAEAWEMNGSLCWNQGSCSTTIESPDPVYNQSFPYLCHEWFNAACCCGV